MNNENAIEVRDVHKFFKVYDDKGNMLRERIIHWNRNRYEKREVLKGISFEVKKGEAIGLIGSNGCGKSTTLKLLTKILRPNSGSIDINGKVYSMIELGAGFHPDMSGRENIYINASIYGVKAKEVDKKLNDIIEFSELEEFIDNPVRTYSSGMYTRLAFAIAINMDADILLIDEILAVGDANFQDKCFTKLREIKKKGTTIVIVSHSLSQVEQICDRSLWIKDGHIELDGKPRDVHPVYMDYMGQGKKKTKVENKDNKNNKRWGNQKARIEKAGIYLTNNENVENIRVGSSVSIKIDYSVREKVENAVFGIGIFRSDGVQVYGTNTRIDQIEEFDLEKDGVLEIYIDRLNLVVGEYTVDLAIEQGQGVAVDYYKDILNFRTYSDIRDIGICRISHIWNM